MAFPGLFPFDVNLILAICAAAFFVSAIMFEIKTLYLSPMFILAVLIALVCQVSLFAEGQLLAPEAWRLQVILYLTATSMFVVGASTPTASLRTWMHIYISLAAVWSIIGLIVWLGATSGLPLGIGPVSMTMEPAVKLAGPFNQGNIFATAIGFAWVFAHWLFIKGKKYIYSIAIVFFTAMFVASMSRGGWVAYTIVIVLLLSALKPRASFCIRWLLPLWLAGISIGILCYSFSQPQLQSNLFIPSASSSFYVRITYWVSAIIEFLDNPLRGIGWGQYGANFWAANPQAQTWLTKHFNWVQIPSSNALSAHNLILHVLAEGGLVMATLLAWGFWKLLVTSMALINNSRSNRLPFALATLGFVLHSQINVVFTRPVPLLMAALFIGIAMAPWLRKRSWRVILKPYHRRAAAVASLAVIYWAGQVSYQWFSAELAMRNLNMDDKATVDKLVKFTEEPRIGTVSLLWLGFTVAKEKKHLGLLVWMSPYLHKSMHEMPSISTYQILFYTLVTSKKYAEACQIGKVISLQRFPNEDNNQAYAEVCENRPPSQYKIGY